jgi:hypothetical protein
MRLEGSLNMENPFTKVLNFMQGDHWESSGTHWFCVAGGGVGFIAGASEGFFHAGIGGAIVYGVVVAIMGLVAGFIVWAIFNLVIDLIPWVIIIGIVVAVFWAIHALWGVGKP